MTTEIIKLADCKTYDFQGDPVRVTLRDDSGTPWRAWWLAKDVCDRLGHSSVAKATSSLDNDERVVLRTLTNGSSPMNSATYTNLVYVSEPGLYKLLLRSRKPEAKAFVRWVTHEVLPTIRRTGRYDSNEQAGLVRGDSDTALALRAFVNRVDRMFYEMDKRQQEMAERLEQQSRNLESRFENLQSEVLRDSALSQTRIDQEGQALIKGNIVEAAEHQGVSFHTIHGRLREKFEVPGYTFLTNEQFQPAISYLTHQKRIDPPHPSHDILDELP